MYGTNPSFVGNQDDFKDDEGRNETSTIENECEDQDESSQGTVENILKIYIFMMI